MRQSLVVLFTVSFSVAFGGCVVVPGQTAGNTWGGAYSARNKPKEEKKEEKKSDAKAPPMNVEPGPYDRPAYVTRVEKGRLWIFKAHSKDLADYLKKGEPGKSVTVLGAGPDGMTVRAPDIETVKGYQHSKPGFETFYKDERVWAFKQGSLFASEMRYFGEPAKNVTLVGRGPNGTSLRTSDTETGEAWIAAPYFSPPPQPTPAPQS
jgi:hypothetical protein